MNAGRANVPLALATLAGLIGVFVGAVFDFHAAASAWLFAAFLAMGLSAGAVSALLTARLTGGAWAEALAPALRPMAGAMPLIGVVFLVLFLFVPTLYPWAGEGAHDHLVGLLFLNWPLVVAKLVVAIAGWSFAAFFVLAMPAGRGQAAAGGMLVFHVVITTFLAYDWVLALQPAFTSSVFGAFTCILFLYSALALAAFFRPIASDKARIDVAGLIIACALGTLYIGFMQFLIIWYGDLPDTSKFYLDRASTPAVVILVAALVVGDLLPIALLLTPAGRRSRGRLRLAAGCALAGIAMHWGWCAMGLAGFAAVLVMPFALLAVFAAFAFIAGRMAIHVRPAIGEAADG